MKKLMYFLLVALMVLISVSCKKDKKPGNPSVKTLEATEVEAFSACLHAWLDFADVKWGGVNFGFFWGESGNTEGKYTPGEGSLMESGAYSAEITGLTPETEYWFKAFVEIDGKPFLGEILKFTTQKSPVVVPEAVDLGIVVNGKSIKWGSFNLGATKPEEYGDYYAWGEMEPKDDYSWTTYKFGTSMYGPFSKYNTKDSYGPVDNKAVLESGPEGDDVASKLLGGKWRMPTDPEWDALRGLKLEWATINGVNGKLVTAGNGNSIFLPAAGWREVTSLNKKGEISDYWSSSVNENSPSSAWGVRFSPSQAYSYNYYRYFGLPIRPVCEE